MTDLTAEIDRLTAANKALTDQLVFARQKASLYYIATSELDTLKRAHRKAPMVDSETITDPPVTVDVSTSTHAQSESVELRREIKELKSEISVLKMINSLTEKTESKRIKFLNSFNNSSSIADNYAEVFQTYLQSTYQSVNHSVEMRKRDFMIGSLLDKIKILESSFQKKLEQAEKIAKSRQEVIQELGEQVKVAINSADKPQPDWESMVAIHAEMEDLRAVSDGFERQGCRHGTR